MAWYRTGTIAVTNGSATVTGTGTAWVTNAAIGEALLAPDGKLYEIANIASDTSITLGSPYLGATQSAQAYVIVPSQSYIRDLAAQAAALVNNYSTFYNTVGQGKFPDGTPTAPSLSFAADPNTGFYRSADNEVTLVANGVAIAKWGTTGFTVLTGAYAVPNLTVLALQTVGTAKANDFTIANISKTLHSGTIVKAIIYDTSKDSDGGAWRKRCTDKSWYTETLGFTGVWRGQLANTAAAWAVSGAAAGDGFQNTTDGKFYTLTGTNTASEIFRGNAREFPAQVAIVAEASKVVIYDLTQADCPMWMVFKATDSNVHWWGTGGAVSTLAALQGKLIVASASSGFRLVDFAKDRFDLALGSIVGFPQGGISSRNNNGLTWAGVASWVIAHNTVSDIAVTTLDTAPIDPATGLPVPTIAVATAGGVSVIKDNGTVVHSAVTAAVLQTAFSKSGVLAYSFSAGAGSRMVYLSKYTSAGFTQFAAYGDSTSSSDLRYSATANSPAKIAQSTYLVVGGGTSDLALIKENPTTPVKGMVAYITNAYNSGWLPGDIRGAYLADTTAGSIAASGEIVTNGTFAADASGWTVSANATIAASSGQLVLARDAVGTGTAYAYQQITTVVGKSYILRADFTKGSASSGDVYISTAPNSGAYAQQSRTTSGPFQIPFVATTTTTIVNVLMTPSASGANVTAIFDNISVKLADPDRSVKNNGLILNGSLTKAAVAAGAQLVSYSGFSAVNYLEQPYNANLDFGTGDFCVMGWAPAGGGTTFIDRGGVSSGGFSFQINGAGRLQLVPINSAGSFTDVSAAASAVSGSNMQFFVGLRRSGTCELWANGVMLYSTASAIDVNGPASLCRVGLSRAGANPAGSMALWRIGATAPSADQIAHIYRTELPLFQPNAKCTIDGTSTAVTALAYDEATDLLHVGTSWGRSAFKGLVRTDSEATTTGAITTLSASQGAVLTGGTSGKYYQPAVMLRDELKRKEEVERALGKVPVFFDFTATASQTAFVVPKGYTAKALYKNGTLMRETTTGVYWTRSNDGFAETCTLSVGASVSDWISIMAVRV